MSSENLNLNLINMKERMLFALEDFEKKCSQQPDEIHKLRQQCQHQQNLIRELERFVQIKKIESPTDSDDILDLKKENQLLKKKLLEKDLTIELMETQLKIYQEDFDSERKDRERSNDKIMELEKQITSFLSWYKQLPSDCTIRNPPSPLLSASRTSSQIFSQQHCPPTVLVRPNQKSFKAEEKIDRPIETSKDQYKFTDSKPNYGREDNKRFHVDSKKNNITDKLMERETFETNYIDERQKKFDTFAYNAKEKRDAKDETCSFENIDFIDSSTQSFLKNSRIYPSLDADNFDRAQLRNPKKFAREGCLECSNCLLTFEANEYMQLIKHLDKCDVTYR